MALNTLPVYAGKADMIGRYEYIHSKLELYVLTDDKQDH